MNSEMNNEQIPVPENERPTMQDCWISVKDDNGLPPYNILVLCFEAYKDGKGHYIGHLALEIKKGRRVSTMTTAEGKAEYYEAEDGCPLNPTHWQPLGRPKGN